MFVSLEKIVAWTYDIYLYVCHMFLIIQLHFICRKDCMQSPTKEELCKLRMYDTIADVQEKNDAVTNAQKKNDASCE